MSVTFSKVMRVSTGADVSLTPSIEQSVMIVDCGRDRDRGRGRGRDFGGGHGSFGEGRGSYCGRQNVANKGPRQCKHCRRKNHIFEKCWEKFNRLEWAQLADTDTPAPSDIAHIHAPSATYSGSSDSLSVVLSHKYDRLRQFEFSQNSYLATHASSSSMNFMSPLLKSLRY